MSVHVSPSPEMGRLAGWLWRVRSHDSSMAKRPPAAAPSTMAVRPIELGT